MTTVSTTLEWTDLDKTAVDTARLLAADAVEKTGNGHPGTAMSLAPAAYLIYQKLMRHNPTDPHWPARDRFVLSCGHSSLTQYIQLYLAGYDVTLEDLKSLRTWGSMTPGHPEVAHTPGIEVTTGPLGQGIGNAVGMAMAARREHGLFDPKAALGQSIFDHHVYVICSDGDLEEGVSAEASSLAGHQQLGFCTTTIEFRSRTTLTSHSARMSRRVMKPTDGMCKRSIGPTVAPAMTRTSTHSTTPLLPPTKSPTSPASSS